MKKNIILLAITCLTSFSLFAQAPKSYTSSEILQQLKKLNTVGSVLYIAAHPDDENTRLIAYLANEKNLRTGYLSLTRGDGGQNLIGPEQGVELGVIRTQELLAARRIDGGEQFFTRAYDFGFSKNPEETFTKWNHDSVLSDVVWVIRNFRPDVIITRFATDGSGGHGHHTASAILAEEAFDAAADPKRFPEQLQYVSVWKTRRLFYNSAARFFNPNADLSHLIKLDVGGYNTLLGKSYGEIAAESRSMHKSQGFGSAKQRGESFEYFKPIKGDTTGLKDIFDGIDLTWKRVKNGEKIGNQIAKVLKDYNTEQPDLVSKQLIEIYNTINEKENPYQTDLLSKIILNCNGYFRESIADKPNYSIDEKIKIADGTIIRVPNSLLKGYNFNSFNRDTTIFTTNKTTPLYWTENAIQNNMFVLTDKNNLLHNNESQPYIVSSYDFMQNSKGIKLIDQLQYKWVDPEKGELYRPLVITPPVMINLTQKSFVFTDENAKEIKVIVKAGKDNFQTKIKANLPLGWTMQPTFANINLAKKGEEQIVSFYIKPSNNSTIETIHFIAEVDGKEYTKGIKEIKYDHIPVQTLFPEAEAKLVKVDVKKTFNTVGYIQGAGDEVPASLEQMGYKVVMITDEQLQNANLNEFPAIVLGVRAFNTNEKLQQYKQRVFDYVKEGGNLIVQYNTNSFAGPLKEQISPIPFKLSRDRVTIEEAPVTFLLPEHPVLNTPNKITAKDFEGWIQERGIYFATDIDSNFQCPLSMNDPNEKPNKGSLIIAKYGKGNYVYTGLAFFRELPAGVPGAYRLFANILSLKPTK